MPEIVWNPRLEHLTSQASLKQSRSCCGQHSKYLGLLSLFKAIKTFQSGNQSNLWFFNFLSVVSVPRGFSSQRKSSRKRVSIATFLQLQPPYLFFFQISCLVLSTSRYFSDQMLTWSAEIGQQLPIDCNLNKDRQCRLYSREARAISGKLEWMHVFTCFFARKDPRGTDTTERKLYSNSLPRSNEYKTVIIIQ